LSLIFTRSVMKKALWSSRCKEKVGKLISGDGYKMRTLKSEMILTIWLRVMLFFKEFLIRLNGSGGAKAVLF
jgi:hypothetical protein